ncbi:thioredoxin family protein [Flavobacteriaceae bacterium]|jgi:peroxiredoxin|nr:thioredoxin family protein [Flavobacteriaceae bacterium]
MRYNKIITLLVTVLLLSSFTNLKIPTFQGYDIGDVATDFTLKNIDNQSVSLADYENARGFIVIFTCNTCPYAVQYEDRIIALNNKYVDQGFPVIAIMPNNPIIKTGDNPKAMKARATSKGFTFPYLFDEGQKIYPQYGATKTPQVYVLEKTNEGNIVRYIGAIDDNYKDTKLVNTKYVEEAIEALKSGRAIEETKTRTIGCSIKS